MGCPRSPGLGRRPPSAPGAGVWGAGAAQPWGPVRIPGPRPPVRRADHGWAPHTSRVSLGPWPGQNRGAGPGSGIWDGPGLPVASPLGNRRAPRSGFCSREWLTIAPDSRGPGWASPGFPVNRTGPQVLRGPRPPLGSLSEGAWLVRAREFPGCQCPARRRPGPSPGEGSGTGGVSGPALENDRGWARCRAHPWSGRGLVRCGGPALG